MTALFETVDQLADPSAQKPADASCPKPTTELSKQTAQAALPLRSARYALLAAEHFRELVPILVARNGKKTQQGCHGWKPAAHGCTYICLFVENRIAVAELSQSVVVFRRARWWCFGEPGSSK